MFQRLLHRPSVSELGDAGRLADLSEGVVEPHRLATAPAAVGRPAADFLRLDGNARRSARAPTSGPDAVPVPAGADDLAIDAVAPPRLHKAAQTHHRAP